MVALLQLNGLGVVRLRLVTPWDGAWFADVDIDPGGVPLPSLGPGPAEITIGTNLLIGTIDSVASGIFGLKASARVVGGRNGWGSSVLPLHWHNDAFVLDEVVIATTGAEVGELATVLIPQPLGTDYVRAAGAASQVLAGYSWHVNRTGTTIVGPRLVVPQNPLTQEVLEFDPERQLAIVASDGILEPGTIFVDPRFGTATARDIEQTWGPEGSRARVWCGTFGLSSSTRLAGALENFVKEKAGVRFLKKYRYRIILEGPDGRVSLQPVHIFGPMPPTLAIEVWAGVPGMAATLYTPGTEVIVEFLDGDPSQPIVTGFSPSSLGKALSLFFDAEIAVVVGEGLAPLTQPVAKAPSLATWAAAVVTACAASSPPITIPPLDPTFVSTKLFTD